MLLMQPSSTVSISPLDSTFSPGERPEAADARAGVEALLTFLGEDVTRDGLIDTAARHVRAMSELCSGYDTDVAALLDTTFAVAYDEMIVVRGVEFISLCEHHLLPFSGHITVGYVPTDRVVGLSKIARVIEAFSHRLQIQERMTHQIATALNDNLHPLGVGVVVTAQHSCMAMRGVRKHGEMVTSCMTGLLRDNPEARAELLALHREP
jgi:GTP cyclohydrolase I